MYLFMKVNKIFIVHYEPLFQRKINLTRQLEENIIKNYEFITDYDRNKVDDETIKKYYTLNKINKTQICITISHVEIYKRIIEEDLDFCLILEDDAILCNNFQTIFNNYLEQIPEDVEIAFINGGCNIHIPNPSPDKIWYPGPSTRTCCAYLITKKTCERLVEKMIPFHNVIDFELNDQIKNLNLKCYWCEPTIVQDGSETMYGVSYHRP